MGLLLVSMLAAEATAAPVELSGYFGTADAARISKAVRMSGDGNKIVYVENLSSKFSGQSLGSLVSPQSMTDGDAASVYLYDITSQTRTLVYRSKFSSTTVAADTPAGRRPDHLVRAVDSVAPTGGHRKSACLRTIDCMRVSAHYFCIRHSRRCFAA